MTSTPKHLQLPYAQSRMIHGSRCLITGGAGFIGSHIAHGLIELGASVVVLDDLSGGHRKNLPPEAELVEVSILDDLSLRSAIEGCSFVFHEAAMVSVPESVEKPRECIELNIEGTRRVLAASKDAGVKRVVFAASAAAYGGEPNLPSRETHAPDPWSPYAASKVAGEMLLRTWSLCYGLSTANLRYFNIYGPRQDPHSAYAAVITAFMDRVARGITPTILGDGQQSRDFTFVSDVVRANLLAATAPTELKGEVFNIGTGVSSTLLDVLNAIADAAGTRIEPGFGPPRAGDVRHSRADISRAREVLGYEPTVSLGEGLRMTYESFVSERNQATLQSHTERGQ
jgi:UDP-glucose 4-epimerase